MSAGQETPRGSDRRANDGCKTERRSGQIGKLPFAERRNGERRTGDDRRKPSG